MRSAGYNTCTGAKECAERVREFSRAGADLIKITRDRRRAIAAGARAGSAFHR